MAKKHWRELSPPARIAIVIGVVIDSAMKSFALRDIWKRSPAAIRGPKWLWGVVVALSNSFGIVPAIYLLWGRRKRSEISS